MQEKRKARKVVETKKSLETKLGHEEQRFGLTNVVEYHAAGNIRLKDGVVFEKTSYVNSSRSQA